MQASHHIRARLKPAFKMLRGIDSIGRPMQTPVEHRKGWINGMGPRGALASPNDIPQVDLADTTSQEQREGDEGLRFSMILLIEQVSSSADR